jgi:hypothetical protein
VEKERHEEYVNKLTKLQDKEGKEIADAFLSIFKSMAKASKGNIKRFQAMMRLSRKKLVRDAVGLVRDSQSKAKNLGKEFGAVKLNAVASETGE